LLSGFFFLDRLGFSSLALAAGLAGKGGSAPGDLAIVGSKWCFEDNVLKQY
jgi:hypothetical protein